MSNDFKIFQANDEGNSRFSILIPSWNNLEMLKMCVQAIQKHSSNNPEVLVFVNEGKDGSAEWLRQNNISHISSSENQGICIAMNELRALVTTDVICYLNDDMYVLPKWDEFVLNEINKLSDDRFLISATMIEANSTGNPCVYVSDFGTSEKHFREDELIQSYESFKKEDWNGSSWPPLFIATSLWDEIEGFSVAFSPGMYSDPDLARKAWEVGTRIFKGVGESKVYHFGSQSTKRVKKNQGRKTFILKWGISSRFFYKKYLRMGTAYSGHLVDPKINLLDQLINKLKYWLVLVKK